MPDTPTASNENLTLADFDAGLRSMTEPATEPGPTAPAGVPTNEPLPVANDEPDVGLTQKGTGEDAVVRRETEI